MRDADTGEEHAPRLVWTRAVIWFGASLETRAAGDFLRRNVAAMKYEPSNFTPKWQLWVPVLGPRLRPGFFVSTDRFIQKVKFSALSKLGRL